MAWRGTLYGMIGGFILGAVGGFVAVMAGNPEQASNCGMIGGYIGSLAASVIALKQALSKHLQKLSKIARPENLTSK